MKNLFLLPGIILLILLTGCKKNCHIDVDRHGNTYKIAVLSDIHYMSPSLLVPNSSTFQSYMVNDGKLLAESDAIFQEAISELLIAKPDLVLIPGDMTKDGELMCHQAVIGYLQQLIDAGIKVRVINGNHDLYNPNAYSYQLNSKTSVARTDTSDPYKGFRKLYENFGYKDAIYKDPNSLSYVSEPIPGLWILALDVCIYGDTVSINSMTAGRIKPETMKWALSCLAEGKRIGKTIFGMEHHAIIPHFTDEQTIFKGFVLNNWPSVSDTMIDAGLRYMFSGHFHATDIAEKVSGNKFLYDISTGSILVYPCSYRMITYVKDSSLAISTNYITHIKSDSLKNGEEFPCYAIRKTKYYMDTLVTSIIMGDTGIHNPAARVFARRWRTAWMANYAGDENILDTQEIDSIQHATALYPPAGYIFDPIIKTMWNDLPPTDKSLMIYLKSGISYKK